jgi:hypothetical protein
MPDLNYLIPNGKSPVPKFYTEKINEVQGTGNLLPYPTPGICTIFLMASELYARQMLIIQTFDVRIDI